MKLHSLPKMTETKKKRLGLGYGSGKGGHTSSRGQKGQKSRGKMPLSFVGTSWVWFKRLPFMRGKSIFNSFQNVRTVTLKSLNGFKNGETVSCETLYTHKLISKAQSKGHTVKVVGSTGLDKKLTVLVPASKGAIVAIAKAEGEYKGETA